MKLIRLKINDPKGFRSLQEGFEIHFLRDWDYDDVEEFNPYILAGPNGSGKSNILEALAAIFYHIECVYLNYRPEGFEYEAENNPGGFKAENAFPDAFEIEYFIPVPAELKITHNADSSDNAHIKIEKEIGKILQVFWLNRDETNENNENALNRSEVKELLPQYVLGYSSGENEILSLSFFKMRFIHFDEYQDRLIKLLDYDEAPEGRLIYLDNEFSQAILLSNLLMQEKDVFKPFQEELGIEGVECFRIIIRHLIDVDEKKDLELPDNNDVIKEIIEEKEDESGTVHKYLKLTVKLKATIDKLTKCSTTHYYDIDTDTLYLDYWVNDATREAFKLHFGTDRELFQAFQILLTLNLYSVSEKLKKELYESSSLYVNETVPVLPSDKRIMRFKDFALKKRGVSETIYSKSLSDGEHQFLHALGLSLLFKDKNCLFLLDEPETHFNPDWRAQFISRIRECFQQSDAQNTMREMLITTHTPFLISDSRKEYVLLLDKDKETHHISVSRPDFNTLGASINKITIEAFGQHKTISGFAEQKLNEFKKRFEEGNGDSEKIIKDTNKILGDSVEKTLFINKVLNSKEE